MTIKFDQNGNELWASLFPSGEDMEIGPSGYLYFTNGQTGAVSKVDPSGNLIWWNFNIFGHALALDGSENVYVTGSGGSSPTGGEMKTVKYSSNGVILWEDEFNGSGNWIDNGIDIAVDIAGNTYATGEASIYDSSGTFRIREFVTIKYDSNGTRQWVSEYHGLEPYTSIPSVIAVDELGGVYVIGSSVQAGSWPDMTTIKYDATNGSQQWIRYYDGGESLSDSSTDLVVDSAGNVYVTGESTMFHPTTGLSNRDYATVKYDTQGIQQWVATYNGLYDTQDRANAIILGGSRDASGFILPPPDSPVYVTGASDIIGGLTDFATIKYTQNGISADLSVVKTGPETSPLGGTFIYTIIVKNEGPDLATGITLIDFLPPEVEFFFFLPPPPGGSPFSCEYDEPDHRVVCALDGLESGATASQVFINVIANEPGTATNTVTVSANEDDPNQDNNTDEWETTIVPPLTTQDRVPTSDVKVANAWRLNGCGGGGGSGGGGGGGGSGGSQNKAYQCVDDPIGSPNNDTDYIEMRDRRGKEAIFGFSNFSIPSGASIQFVRVTYVARADGGTADIKAALRLNRNIYVQSTSQSLSSTWSAYSYDWVVNPETGNPWTVSELNSSALEGFGVVSGRGRERVTQVFITVGY